MTRIPIIRSPMTLAIERRSLIGWIIALLGLPALGACRQGERFGQRGGDEDDGGNGTGGGMSGGGGSGGGGY